MVKETHPTFANGKICYIELPSIHVEESSSFYKKVFNWEIRTRGDGSIAFNDGVNEVSGTWRTDRKPKMVLGIYITKRKFLLCLETKM